MTRSGGRRVLAVDCAWAAALLALVLAVGDGGAGAAVGAETGEVLPGAGTVLAAAACTATVLRRRDPVLTLVAVLLLTATAVLAGAPLLPALLPLLVALYAAGAHAPLRRSAVAAAAALVVTLTAVALATLLHAVADERTALLLPAWAGWVLAPWALGAALRLRDELAAVRQVAAEMRDRTVAAESGAAAAEQEAAEAAARLATAVAAQDAVGHDVAAIGMRAAVALHVADRRPGDARAALRDVRHRSDVALAALREVRAGAPAPAAPARPGEAAADAGLGRWSEQWQVGWADDEDADVSPLPDIPVDVIAELTRPARGRLAATPVGALGAAVLGGAATHGATVLGEAAARGVVLGGTAARGARRRVGAVVRRGADAGDGAGDGVAAVDAGSRVPDAPSPDERTGVRR